MMRKKLFIPLLMLALFAVVSVFSFYSIRVYITGHLKKNPADTSASINSVFIILKGDGKILAKSVAYENGKFDMNFLHAKEKSYDFFCTGLGMDTILLASMQSFESDQPDITLVIPAVIKKNKSGHPICPKCRKADKIYKIAYGNGLPVTLTITSTGDTTYSNIVGKQYNESTCISGLARYYCDRDRVKF